MSSQPAPRPPLAVSISAADLPASQDPVSQPLPDVMDPPEMWDHFALACGGAADLQVMTTTERRLFKAACERIQTGPRTPVWARGERPATPAMVDNLTQWPSANIGRPFNDRPGARIFADAIRRCPDDRHPEKSPPKDFGNRDYRRGWHDGHAMAMRDRASQIAAGVKRGRALQFMSGAVFGLLIAATLSLLPHAADALK